MLLLLLLSGTETFDTGDGRFKDASSDVESGLEVSRNSRVNVGADGGGYVGMGSQTC